MEKKHLLLLATLALCTRLYAQDELSLGFLPNIQVEGHLFGSVEYFVQTGSELTFVDKTEGQPSPASQLRALSLDLVPGITFDLGTRWNLAAAFVARRRNPFSNKVGNELRPWQQATYALRFGKYRLRSRFRAEQRFTQRELGGDFKLTHRLRYRASVDFPLNGDRLDDHELYFNGSAEWLVTLPGERAVFYGNKRATANLGYRFNSKNRLEAGIELRSQNLDEAGSVRQIWFLRTTFVKKI